MRKLETSYYKVSAFSCVLLLVAALVVEVVVVLTMPRALRGVRSVALRRAPLAGIRSPS